MATLEDLKRGSIVTGVRPGESVTVVDIRWHGSNVVELTYKDSQGKPGSTLLYRDNEPSLEIIDPGRAWSFDGDGNLFRLVSEAKRIGLAHLFDPLLAVHTSVLEPLPHQIDAVYGHMLPRQPLRFLLADDPGAGKTIMTGLLMKELLVRGDLNRCLVVCPGNLAEQWQDELWDKFQIHFEIISRDSFEQSVTGNPFVEKNFVIARLDQLSRNEDIQEKLNQPDCDWDLIVCDEAHKMSATYFGNELKETKRHKLGKLLGGLTRHFLLLTATPHNGKEIDFQLFMSLLDADRFEGKFRDGVHLADASDLMRRLVKEQMVKLNKEPLFPERFAYTVEYKLSDPEAELYHHVTDYVTEEMNRADRLKAEGEGRRGNMVGFALTILQRRLASSPEAIYCSLQRRRERLEKRIREEELARRGVVAGLRGAIDTTSALPTLDDLDDTEEFEDQPSTEVEEASEEIIALASAAKTIEELKKEIDVLRSLEDMANKVRFSGADRKWEEMSRLMQDRGEMFDAGGQRRKLIVFSEHRDTVRYILKKIRTVLGSEEAVVEIHGGIGREERRKVQEKFTQDKDVLILVATDAAGEGINLQRSNLVINYDLPWNPNRIEQRFGRVHRIGQSEPCHLWNMVAPETREGDVYHRLLKKLEAEREALGGKVFDVLGKLFREHSLRELLIRAIREGGDSKARDQLHLEIDGIADRAHIDALLDDHALVPSTLTASKIAEICEQMDRAEARRLQPHFISAFFREAFRLLGGTLHEREPRRYEATHVPGAIRTRDRQIGTRNAVQPKYERLTFDREQITVKNKPLATFVCPGHPLLDCTIDLILEQHRDLLKKGTVLVAPDDPSVNLRALFYLEHSVNDARADRHGNARTISKQLLFVEVDSEGRIQDAGFAPYLDYQPISDSDRTLVFDDLNATWLKDDLESSVLSYAATELVPRHLGEIRTRKLSTIERTAVAVKDRLTKEINYWDHRAEELKAKELAGHKPKLNSIKARKRADDLADRLQRRMKELDQERHISASPPVVTGGALIVPQGLLDRKRGTGSPVGHPDAQRRMEIDSLAVLAVLEAERKLGRLPVEMPHNHKGYDIESKDPVSGNLKFIEVKGKAVGVDTVTISKSQIITGLNKPDDFILAIVSIDGAQAGVPAYVRRPFEREPDFAVTSVNYNLAELLARAESPR